MSILGALALTMAPMVGAQGFGFGGGMHGRGHIGMLGADIDEDTRAEIHAEIEACKEDNGEDREAVKACVDAVFANYGIERPERPGRDEQRPELPEEARDELEDCREENEGDREAGKACADAVFEKYGIEKPDMPMGGRPGMRMGHEFRAQIEETCGEREDTDEWKECAKEARGDVREDFRENHPGMGGLFRSADLRNELKACLDLEDNDELRECVFGVRAEIRANLGGDQQ